MTGKYFLIKICFTLKTSYLLNGAENIVAKEEIACFEQFLLLSQCLQKLSAVKASESVCLRERDKGANQPLAKNLNKFKPAISDLDR